MKKSKNLLSIKSLTELLANFDNYNKLTPYNNIQICTEDDVDADRFDALIVNNDVYNEAFELDNYLIEYEKRIFYVYRCFVNIFHCGIEPIDTTVFNSHRVATIRAADCDMAIKKFKKLK